MASRKTPARQDRTDMAAAVVTAEAVAQLENADKALVRASQGARLTTWKGALAITGAMQEMRAALNAPGVLDSIMQLQGTPVGFLTDKDKDKGYPAPVVADVAITARLHGAYLVNNEVNIIGGRCFLAQSFYDRKVKELLSSGSLQSLDIDYGIPRNSTGGAVTEVNLTWKRPDDPGPKTKTLNIPVRVNAGQGTDAILGKVKRRVDKWLFDHITGQNTPAGDVGDGVIDVDVVQPRPDRTKATTVEHTRVDDGKMTTTTHEKQPNGEYTEKDDLPGLETPPPTMEDVRARFGPTPAEVIDALGCDGATALRFFQAFEEASPFRLTAEQRLRDLPADVRTEIVDNPEAWQGRLSDWLESVEA